jgi:hypothetical protein
VSPTKEMIFSVFKDKTALFLIAPIKLMALTSEAEIAIGHYNWWLLTKFLKGDLDTLSEDFWYNESGLTEFLPYQWQTGFLKPATDNMESIIDLHHDIFFFLIIISIYVSYMLFFIVLFFRKKNEK